MIGDNAPPLDGWRLPMAKCCGLIATSCVCEMCLEFVPKIPPNVILSDN